MLNDSAELNAAADKPNKPIKNPKIQSLLDEIINDNSSREQSISQGSSQKKKLPRKKESKAEMSALPRPPPEIVAELFPDEVDSVAEVADKSPDE